MDCRVFNYLKAAPLTRVTRSCSSADRPDRAARAVARVRPRVLHRAARLAAPARVRVRVRRPGTLGTRSRSRENGYGGLLSSQQPRLINRSIVRLRVRVDRFGAQHTRHVSFVSRHRKLSAAICELVSDYGLLSFHPLDISVLTTTYLLFVHTVHVHSLSVAESSSDQYLFAGLGISIFEYRYTEILKLFSVIF